MTDAFEKQKFRMVMDYRNVNEITVDDNFPISTEWMNHSHRIDEILDKLGRCQYLQH